MDEHAFLDGMRAPKLALPGGPRRWIEDSFRLLTEHFGVEPLRRPPVLPGDFVPVGYDGSEAAARELCATMCERMGVPFERVHFSFRLETVSEAAGLFGSAMLDLYVDPDHPVSRGAAPGDLAAVRAHSDRLGTASFEQVDRIIESGLTDLGVDLRPVVQRLGMGEFGAEVVRCLLIASGSDPEQRAERVRAAYESDVRRRPAVGRWLDLAADCPGVAPIPGQSAVLLRSDVLADPLKLLAATSHELSHELLSRAELPWATGPLEEPLTDLCALFHGFGIALVNAAVDETTLDDEWVHTSGYLGEHALAEALALYRFRQHQLVRDGPLLPEWHQALDPEPRARFAARLDDLTGGPPTVLGW
ncbi:hypothetical protein [Kribbella sindirgiensis]|uniref:Uncharacterized protein n=1 Tax=Kribbella sindirgiensis TaxID=1124744 RepID=A0A4R0J3F5_9ACTN|nr:hypothetical protein [Kribbella sindirgiensis]TCC39644.1 hypothetical protein E0H50_06915 [Kribbella sindirgiensis]